MLTKKVKSKIFILFSLTILLSIIIFLIFKSLEDNVVFFFSPSDIYKKQNISYNKKIRVGGLVKINSIKIDVTSTKFIITDLKNEIIVTYKGVVPNLFEEGKGVVAEGFLKDRSYLKAKKILAKHDENYMPPEVSESLKK